MTDTSELNSHYPSEPPLGVFTIEIAGPGGSGATWRPFPGQELSLAEYARKIVERFDFKAEVSELAVDRDPEISRPGIILIDPRLMAVPGGRAALEAATAELPRWVLPMLVLGQSDDSLIEDLAHQVRDILVAAGALRARSARRGAVGVRSFQAFSVLMRDLLIEAETQYIAERSRQRYGAPVRSRSSSSWPGSPMPSGPDRFTSASDRLGETPDAR